MSEENVEIVRRAHEIFNRYIEAKTRGDQDGLNAVWEAATELMSPDFEFREDPKWPGAQTYHGLEEFRRVVETYFQEFGQQVVVGEEFFDAGFRVLAFSTWRARGTASGAETEMRQGWVFTLRDGRIAKWEIYFDRAEALDAAGLSE